MSAALLASPLVPLASAQTGGSGGTTTEENGASEAERVLAGDAILRYGDTGAAVVAVQAKLAVDDDGIFGPITEGAVEDFQGRIGIPVTGEVDSRTWTELFRTVVSFVPEDSSEAKAIQASVASDAAVAEPEAPAPKPKAPADEHEHEPEKAASKDDDKAKEPEAQKGGDRPEAGIEKSSKEPDPVIEVSDKVAVSGGGSCATGKMATPVKGTVTGVFGEDRGSHRHGGLDIAAPTGTAVRAALCGTVTQAGAQGAYGNIVCIRHTAESSTCYAHLSSFNTRAGEYVAVGQLIGRVGSTGRSSGPHLHFETRINGRAHDPEPYLRDEKRMPGTGEEPTDAQRASASSSSSSSSSGETRTASTQDGEYSGSGTGGGTPPNGVAYEESRQGSGSASTSEPRQAQAQEQQSAPAQQQQKPAPAQEQQQKPAPAQEQQSAPAQQEQQSAPAEEPKQAPAQQQQQQQQPAPEQQEEQASAQEPAAAKVAATPQVAVSQTVAPEVNVAAQAPAEPVAPAEEAPAAPVVEETPAAPVVEEAPAAEVVEETPAAVVPAAPAG